MNINIKSPVVSIIITVYNRKRTFFRALDSVLNQSYNNYEVIVVDDGSEDNFHAQLFKLMKFDYRVKYIRHSNRKTVLSLNTGIKIAKGKFITFLDSDDEYERVHIAKRINFFKNNKKVDLIHSPALLIGNPEDMLVPDAKSTKKLIHLNDCIIGATLFGRNEVFCELGGFRNVYSYDSDFVKRAEKRYNVKKFDLKTYIYYRNSKDSILSNLKKSINEN